jgi:hypothetical protein
MLQIDNAPASDMSTPGAGTRTEVWMHRHSSAAPAQSPSEGQRETREGRGFYDTGYLLEGPASYPENGALTEHASPVSFKGTGGANHFAYWRVG